MNKELLTYLVCPSSGASLVWRAERAELWCRASRLAYPVREGIAVMCLDQARDLTDAECAQIEK